MSSVLKASLAYFVIVFTFAFILGTVRVLVVAPRLGELVAVILEVPLVIFVSYLAARFCTARFAVPANKGPRLVMGLAAFALLMAVEFILSVLMFGRPPSAFLTGFTHLPGQIGLAGQIVFGLMPWLVTKH
jgi:hypothetical protein